MIIIQALLLIAVDCYLYQSASHNKPVFESYRFVRSPIKVNYTFCISRFSLKEQHYSRSIKSFMCAVCLFHILTKYSKLFMNFMFLRKAERLF